MTLTDNASGRGPASKTGPGELRNNSNIAPRAPMWAYLLITAGALVLVATYVAILMTQPATLGLDLGTATLWVLVGYLIGAALLAAGTLPLIPRSIYALMPIAIALNISIGYLVGHVIPIPLYLDSIGTIIIGAMAGPAAGTLTGVLGNLIAGLTLDPSMIAFTAGAAFAGAAAGWAARLGAFRAPWWAIIAGAIAGIPGGALGAPVAAFIFGGGLGVGTGGFVATLQAAGLEMVNATTVQSLTSDILDKAIIFFVAYLVLWALPKRIVGRYPLVRRSQRRRFQGQTAR